MIDRSSVGKRKEWILLLTNTNADNAFLRVNDHSGTIYTPFQLLQTLKIRQKDTRTRTCAGFLIYPLFYIGC